MKENDLKELDIACRICCFQFDIKDLDLLYSVFKLVDEKKGEVDVKSICKLIGINEIRYKTTQKK
jgi:hypothetical protein